MKSETAVRRQSITVMPISFVRILAAVEESVRNTKVLNASPCMEAHDPFNLARLVKTE